MDIKKLSGTVNVGFLEVEMEILKGSRGWLS